MTDKLDWHESEFLVFKEGIPKTKTKLWEVESKTGGFLGVVKWYANWRKYCFFPESGTVFDAKCLQDIQRFCAGETDFHKNR